jgi:hypothetical protein
LERDGKAGRENLDGDVVQIAAARLDLFGETALELRRHADEDVIAFPCHGQ